MKAIIDITEEGVKYAKRLCMDGVADDFLEAIANAIPVINGTELASLLIDMRINGDINDTTFIVPRKNDNYNNEVIVKRYKAKDALQQESDGDCISRQAVLDILKEKWNMFSDANDAIQESIDTIEALQPVTPQPKTGRWIRVDKDKLRCSECEVIHLIAQYPNGKVDWCPNCGANMVKPQAESEIHCNFTDEEIAKSFIEDVEAVKDLLPKSEGSKE